MQENKNNNLSNSDNLYGNNGIYNQQNNQFVNNNDLYNKQINNAINNNIENNNSNIENNENYYNQQNASNINNPDYNIVDKKFENQNIKNVFTKTFWFINMYYIVPAVFVFGLVFAIGSALSGGSKILTNLVLILCFGYSILMVLLFILYTIKDVHNDIQQNGFSVFGKTTKDKIKSISIICIVIFYLIIFLFGKFK